ncbi:MAG TPA: DEAD/DEAH box helicase family protein, partial [Egibacteraceae bacterium]|nr:DEAD/DEAH box helicase family protein [Egibacteraceae bacterium]
MEDGLYEQLLTEALEQRLAQLDGRTADRVSVDAAEAPGLLARHVAEVLERELGAQTAVQRVALVNVLLERIAAPPDPVLEGPEQLHAVRPAQALGADRFSTRPEIALGQAALLTNGRGEPALNAELAAEILSADSVDLLCAFVQWSGLRVLEHSLRRRAKLGIPLRVITSTYVGATERRALDELVARFGAEVRVSYEARTTRLHAKAWLFRRRTGFDTAYVGSSNLSRSALVSGLEWNVRLSAVATRDLLEKFAVTFDSYWADPTYEPYDPDRDADRLDDALAEAGGRRAQSGRLTISGLTVRAYPHQREILERLDVERAIHDRHRNLVVAATGTGKTVVAALDYQRLLADAGRDLSLLFVAHRKEILGQSQRTYREVLADGAFAETYVDGAHPERWRHVFASIQSLSSYGVDRLPPDAFDVVVIDEFHHAEAATYRRLLDHLRPVELLGLTATPERADGRDVREFFGGRTAAELRLWDALAADLLCPFHYFGVADDVSLEAIEWKRGAYDTTALESLYTGNDARVAKVLRELRDKVTDVTAMRALGFCVSVAHAQYMARVFTDAGVPARAVSGETASSSREDALRALRERQVNVLFAVDLFNEGLDVPDVDTVLLLRPTQSATVFLQQLGRGLRRAPGKAVLTVLDFIGAQRREFRFDLRYRALTGSSRKGLIDQVAGGFPYLPSGCALILDRVAQQIVLDNVRAQVELRRPALVADVRSHGDLDLAGYLREADRELADIYRRPAESWTALRRDAGLPTPPAVAGEQDLLKRVRTVAHVDNPERAELYTRLQGDEAPAYEQLNDREQRLARMLFWTLWPDAGGATGYGQG